MTANEVIDDLIRYSDDCMRIPNDDHVAKAYECTSTADPLRKLMTDHYFLSEAGRKSTEQLDLEAMPQALYRDVAVSFWKAKHEMPGGERKFLYTCVSGWLHEDRCRYHQHNERHPVCTDLYWPRAPFDGWQ